MREILPFAQQEEGLMTAQCILRSVVSPYWWGLRPTSRRKVRESPQKSTRVAVWQFGSTHTNTPLGRLVPLLSCSCIPATTPSPHDTLLRILAPLTQMAPAMRGVLWALVGLIILAVRAQGQNPIFLTSQNAMLQLSSIPAVYAATVDQNTGIYYLLSAGAIQVVRLEGRNVVSSRSCIRLTRPSFPRFLRFYARHGPL